MRKEDYKWKKKKHNFYEIFGETKTVFTIS